MNPFQSSQQSDASAQEENESFFAALIFQYDLYLVKPETTTTAILALVAFRNEAQYESCISGQWNIQEKALTYIEKQTGGKDNLVLNCPIKIMRCNQIAQKSIQEENIGLDFRSMIAPS